MKIFAERLKELRIENNLTTIELAEKLNVKNPTISRWENEVQIPNIEYLYKIAKLFNITSDYLIGLEN